MADERGRVPFAVVGVLLLLASATLSVASVPERPRADPGVDVAMERLTGETRTAVRHAALRASDAAARRPVLVPANTSAGRALNGSRPFRDALRVRIYRRARDRLADASARQGDVTASASLPPTPNASALERATARVHLERAGENGTALAVTVENVTVTARRGGRTVGRRRTSPTVVVETPVLALHEAVERYETRLNRGVGKPGLAQGVTARLLQVAWFRGYAQYGTGGTIENVVGNHHVELVTNGAILAEQRAVFGRSDAAGKRALRRATARVAFTDLFNPQARWPRQWTDLVLRGGPVGRNDTATIPRVDRAPSVPGPDSEFAVRVDEVADRAFGNAVATGNVSAVVEAAYSVPVRRRHETEVTGGDWPDRPDRPDRSGDWAEEDAYTTIASVDSVAEVAARDGADVTAPSGRWHRLATRAYAVDVTMKRVREFADGNRTARTTETSTVEYRVVLWLEGDHVTPSPAPDRPVPTAHRRGVGPFDGPNLADVERKALDRLVASRGGGDALARRAVRGDLDEATATVRGARPDGLRYAVVENLTALRERVANVSAAVERERVGTMRANPAGELVAELERRRGTLVGAPGEYGSVAEKATVAARAAYLDRVLARLRDQRRTHRDAGEALDDALAAASAGSTALLRDAMANRRRTDVAATGRTDDGVGIAAVNGAPPYLTLGQVGHGQVPAVPAGRTLHPLAARNVNAFTLPYAEVTDGVFAALFGSSKTVSLGHAARTLRAARRVDGNETFSRWRRRLERQVESEVDGVRDDLRRALADEGVGSDERERERILAAGLSRWEGPAARAVALSNGSAVAPVARAAAARTGANDTRRTVVRSRLSFALRSSLADHGVKRGTVNPPAAATRQYLKYRTGPVVERTLRRHANRGLDRLEGKLKRELHEDLARRLGEDATNRVPTGLPLLPVGTWYATTNVWFVEVHGAYPRFAVSARRSAPDGPGGTLTYVREAASVRFDFDGDGTAERFGRNERVSFGVETAVAVAVPPGPPGVGDLDGNMDERSAGWPEWEAGTNGSAPPGWPPE